MDSRHYWQSTVTDLLSLKVNNHLSSGPYSKKTKQKKNQANQTTGVIGFACYLPITSRERLAVWVVTALHPWLISSLTPCEHTTALNLCPVVWIKNGLASSLFTIRNAKVSSLVQLNYHSIPMQGPWKDKIIHCWNLKEKPDQLAEISKWQGIMWIDTGREIYCRDVCSFSGIIYGLHIKHLFLRNF